MTKKVLLSWSCGKDSAWTLYTLQQNRQIEVVGLLTAINEEYQRVSIHGIRRQILETQAKAVNLPLWTIPLPKTCCNEDYEEAFCRAALKAKDTGVSHIAFGDLFLEEIRDYRIALLKKVGLEPLFPLWGAPTKELAHQMIDGGLKGVITTIDPQKIPTSFIGHPFDREFLEKLPDSVDPCGENGEFHTCVYEGPMFNQKISLEKGELVEREGFVYLDLNQSLATKVKKIKPGEV